MRLKNRVIKLEATAPKKIDPIHILNFIVDPENMDSIGYRCEDGTEIIRQADESEEKFKKRCHDSVAWSLDASCHILFPIYE